MLSDLMNHANKIYILKNVCVMFLLRNFYLHGSFYCCLGGSCVFIYLVGLVVLPTSPFKNFINLTFFFHFRYPRGCSKSLAPRGFLILQSLRSFFLLHTLFASLHWIYNGDGFGMHSFQLCCSSCLLSIKIYFFQLLTLKLIWT